MVLRKVTDADRGGYCYLNPDNILYIRTHMLTIDRPCTEIVFAENNDFINALYVKESMTEVVKLVSEEKI